MPTTPAPNPARRRWLQQVMGLASGMSLPWLGVGYWTSSRVAHALPVGENVPIPIAQLDVTQTRQFRAWMVRIIDTQLRNHPTPRWVQRDCVGLVRFAVAEALREHDWRWQRANGLSQTPLPPELTLSQAQRALRHQWRLNDGTTSAYIGALELVQENSRFISKDWNQAEPGDLLFYDQGDNQHLMVWMGRYVAYHTGSSSSQDNGLRAVTIQQLLTWKDTRWQPSYNNPNFLGIYRLAFLSP